MWRATLACVLGFVTATPARADEISDLDALASNARLSAQQGFCQTAVRYANQVLAIDPAHEIAREPVIDACIATVTGEPKPEPTPTLTRPIAVLPPPTVLVSYRRHVIIADLISLGLLFVDGIGSITYVFGAPLVHAMHGNSDAATKSFGLRLLPWVALVGIALVGGQGCNGDDCLGIALLALGGGAVTAVVVSGVDASVLAKKWVPAPSWSPVIVPSHGGATIGIAGRW